MKKQAMKIVGGRNLPAFWDRFDRLQRTANLLLPRGICPKGVFRFKTFQEFEEWKNKLRLEPPNKAT
jgi:hypothetical protein